MTRETKIGLLVGLGFIVVFAVVLSHNGTAPAPSEGLTPIANRAPDAEVTPGAGTPLTELPVIAETPRLESGPLGLGSLPESTGELAEGWTENSYVGGMVAPESLDRTGIFAARISDEPTRPDEMLAIHHAREVVRVAPNPAAPLDPDPVLRPDGPTPTEDPSEVAELQTTPPAPAQTVAQGPIEPPGPYLVKRGDNLVTIAKELYGNSSPRVVDHLVKANKLKNRDFVVEGQSLKTPPLPPDLFEPVIHSTRAQEDIRLVQQRLDESIDSRKAPRALRAPESANTSESKQKPDKPKSKEKPDERFRWYEVQPKDTFSSIAEKHLGSTVRWSEIQELNKNIDPGKMLPGTKIKLPAKEPVSAAVSSKRVSA